MLNKPHAITHCCNEKCKKDLRLVNPVFSDGKLDFCSRLCRYEQTGEVSQGTTGKADYKPGPAAKTFIPDRASGSQPSAKLALDKPQTKESRAPRTPSKSGGKIHILLPDHKFSGIRGQVWAMITEGQEVSDLIDKANAAGLDGKGVLRKLETHFKVVDIQ